MLNVDTVVLVSLGSKICTIVTAGAIISQSGQTDFAPNWNTIGTFYCSYKKLELKMLLSAVTAILSWQFCFQIIFCFRFLGRPVLWNIHIRKIMFEIQMPISHRSTNAWITLLHFLNSTVLHILHTQSFIRYWIFFIYKWWPKVSKFKKSISNFMHNG